MGFWNYRVILKDGQYAIHEVFYNDQGEAWTCTEDPVGVAGDTLAELAEDLEHYRQALDRPVLAYEDFPNEQAAPEVGDTTPWEEVRAELVAEELLDE